jgi:hypothetical protein
MQKGPGKSAGPHLTILTWENFFSSLVFIAAAQQIDTQDQRRNAVLGSGKPDFWLTSAKGGDPMSHGSAERSASSRAEHYR